MIVVNDINPSAFYDVTSASKLVSASATALRERCITGELAHTKSSGGRYVIRGADLIDRVEYEQKLRKEEKQKRHEDKIEEKRRRDRERYHKKKAEEARHLDNLAIERQGLKQAVLAEIDRLRARVALMPD